MLSWVPWRCFHEEQQQQQQQQNVLSNSTKYLIEHVLLLPLQGCSKRQAPCQAPSPSHLYYRLSFKLKFSGEALS
jgi:hypothetical protein